jgi:hypothetical protein
MRQGVFNVGILKSLFLRVSLLYVVSFQWFGRCGVCPYGAVGRKWGRRRRVSVFKEVVREGT